MYILSKLFTAFFLPPGILITILFLFGLFRKRVRLALWGLAFFWYLLSTPFFGIGILAWLESSSKTNLSQTDSQAVVILGGGSWQGYDPIPLSSDALKRALVGVSYAKTHNLPIFFSGGGIKTSSEAEAFLISLKNIFEPFDIDLNSQITLMTEGNSRNTIENAKFLANLLAPKKTISLVTSAYHMKRAKYIFENFGFKIVEHPTDFKRDYPHQLKWQDFLPSLGGLRQSYIISHELFGILSLWPQKIWSPF